MFLNSVFNCRIEFVVSSLGLGPGFSAMIESGLRVVRMIFVGQLLLEFGL